MAYWTLSGNDYSSLMGREKMFKIITEDADSQIANFFDWVAVYAGMATAR
jgi:hypothetical protein